MTNYSYTLTYDPDNVSPVDISDYLQQAKWIEAGSGEIRSSTLTLDCRDGAFITNTNSGATPILDEFDLIQLSVTDEDSNTFTVNYEVDKLKPVDTVQRGTVQDFELLGPEQHLLRFPIAIQSKRRDQADSAYTKSNEIIDLYNARKGSLQPTISAHDTTANTLPKYTANHYPFSVRPWKAYEALNYIHDRVGSSVAAGGGGDFWEFGFNRNSANELDLKFYSVISGDTSSGVTIDQAVDVNPGEEEGGIESTRATVKATWGADGFGTYPPQVGQFRDALTAWAAMPDYISGETYPANSIVRRRNSGPDSQGDELHFKANKETSSAPPTTETDNTDWDSHTFLDFLATEIGISGTYSPWTLNRDDEWKNNGANPGGTQNDDPPLTTSLYVWDMNQVIYDDTFFRIDVDVRATSPAAINANYKYSGNFYRGFRVLVDGSNGTNFGSSDFDNNIIEYDDDNDEWRLFRSTSNDEYVAVDAEAKVYKKSGGTWSDDSSNNEANDCYHPVYSISNVSGHIDKDNGAGGTYGDSSAVQYEFRYAQNDITSLSSRTYYRAGACINLRAPFSHSSYNGATIGDVFGSDATVREPVTFDTNNLDYSSNSKRGFNHDRADEYGPFEGIRFMTNFEWRYSKDGSGSLIRAGNIPCKCYMYDIHGNVVTADFTISHNDNWEEITIPFSAFNNYRARIPWSLESSGSNAFLQELEILQRFDYTNIRKIGFQWMAPYDDAGRYTLLFSAFGVLFPNLEDILLGLANDGFNIKWKIDAFHFVKPLLSVSAPVTTGRAMFTDFDEEPLIYNRYQLDQANLAKLEQDQFRYRSYEIVTEGRFDINLFESFNLKNTDIINDADSGANTVTLVAKKIEYTITKPDASTAGGGFMRKILGVKRLT